MMEIIIVLSYVLAEMLQPNTLLHKHIFIYTMV